MSEKEYDARRMIEQLKKLPEAVQERVGYIIEGAALVHTPTMENHASASGTQKGV